MVFTLSLAPSSRALFTARKSAPQPTIRAPRVVVLASQRQPEEKSLPEKLALPAAAFLGAALLFAATPDDALAARSGGRVGGSSGFSRSRAAAPAPSRGPVVNNNYYSAPPVFGGGFGVPFFPGFGGYGFGFGVPVFGLSSLFNFFLLSIAISVVWTVISNVTNGPRNDSNSKKDDEW